MSIFNRTLTFKFRTFLLCVVIFSSLLTGCLRLEVQSAWMNKELVERADRIEELEGFLEDAHSLNHKLFKKVDDLRDGPTLTDRKAAYARLYK